MSVQHHGPHSPLPPRSSSKPISILRRDISPSISPPHPAFSAHSVSQNATRDVQQPHFYPAPPQQFQSLPQQPQPQCQPHPHSSPPQPQPRAGLPPGAQSTTQALYQPRPPRPPHADHTQPVWQPEPQHAAQLPPPYRYPESPSPASQARHTLRRQISPVNAGVLTPPPGREPVLHGLPPHPSPSHPPSQQRHDAPLQAPLGAPAAPQRELHHPPPDRRPPLQTVALEPHSTPRAPRPQPGMVVPSAPVSPPPRTVSTTSKTLPPGAEPATLSLPSMPSPATPASLYDRSGFAPRQPPPQTYDRSAAFGQRTSATADRPARYNLAAAFGPSKAAPARAASVRYNPAAAFGPQPGRVVRSDAGHEAPGLPPGAGVPVTPQPHSDAVQPRAGRAHQFGEEPIPIPHQPSAYATPVSTPPVARGLEEVAPTTPPRPRRSPSRDTVGATSAPGLPSPPQSPPKPVVASKRVGTASHEKRGEAAPTPDHLPQAPSPSAVQQKASATSLRSATAESSPLRTVRAPPSATSLRNAAHPPLPPLPSKSSSAPSALAPTTGRVPVSEVQPISPSPTLKQRLPPAPLVNQTSRSSLAPNQSGLGKQGSTASLRVPEPPIPTPAPSKQPSTASLRIPRTESPKPLKQASATSLRLPRTDSPLTPAVSKQPSTASLRHNAAPPSPRPRAQNSSTSLRAPSSKIAPSARSVSASTSPQQNSESSANASEPNAPLTPPETPPRTRTPLSVFSLGSRVWRLEHVRKRVVDILVKDRRHEPHSPPVLSRLMCVNRAAFCAVVEVLYADALYCRLPLNLPVPTHRMSVYRASVHKLDLTGCVVACRGPGFFEHFETFPNLDTIACGKVEMARPTDCGPLNIRVTRRLPMRGDGIFYTINPFEPCLPRSQDARVSYALEFGGMPRAGAQRFAEGQKNASVPPVLCRAIHSLATDESHSARAWLSILARRAQDGYPYPPRLLLSQTSPISLGEFAAFASGAGAIEALRLAVDLTDPAITPVEFFDTVDWSAFGALKTLHLALFVPAPPRAEEHFSTRVRLDNAAMAMTPATTTPAVTVPIVSEEPPSPTIEEAKEPLRVRERVSRPVSGLFKGLGALAKGFKKLDKDPRPRVDSEPARRDTETVRPPARPMSECRPPSILDPDFGVWPAEPSAAPPKVAPPELALADLRLTLAIHLPEWAAYEAGGDDWGYVRASVPHPAQLARALLRFGACPVHVRTQTTVPVDGVEEISADYEMRVVGRIADAFGRYGPFGSDAERSMYIDN
ncbi:unnamed protein product [Cutaneotrichosporon oleaginosum]